MAEKGKDMVFRGISCRFSTKDNEQYNTIGDLWDFCTRLYGLEKWRGLGYNWTPESIEYVMGLTDGEKPELTEFLQRYPQAVYKEILLPEQGWKEYRGRRDKLEELYTEIYREGAPAYEIESFSGDDSCKVSICRDYLPLEILEEDSLEEIQKLYRSAVGTEGCVWDEDYPNGKILREDIGNRDLFGIRDGQGRIVAAIARDRDEETDSLACWDSGLAPSAELARLVVASEYRNQGMARVLIRQAMKLLAGRGYRGVHFLVAVKNQQALRSYRALDFTAVGETDLFGQHFLCYEKKLERVF